MVETSVSLSLTLLLLFGAFDFGLMGYFQLQLDGATFFFTHAFASGAAQPASTQNQYGTNLKGLFPNVATANMTPIPAAPPTTDVPVNYIQWGAYNNRYGGASLLRPQRMQAQATYQVAGLSWNALFPQSAQPITLSAGNVDARPVIGNHDDDAQGADFNSQTVYGSVVDPLVGDDQNVPPYYFNFGFMWDCTPNLDSHGNYVSSGWSKGTCPKPELNSLGLAEFLKDDNYTSAKFPNDGIDSGGTYEYMKYHQQMYGAISMLLTFAPTMPSQSLWNPIANYIYGTLYSWDVPNVEAIGAESASELGRQYPLHPGNGCSWC